MKIIKINITLTKEIVVNELPTDLEGLRKAYPLPDTVLEILYKQAKDHPYSVYPNYVPEVFDWKTENIKYTDMQQIETSQLNYIDQKARDYAEKKLVNQESYSLYQRRKLQDYDNFDLEQAYYDGYMAALEDKEKNQ